jgi:outer membrane immunogenic protein
MRKLVSVLALGAGLAIAAPAFAQDYPAPPPADPAATPSDPASTTDVARNPFTGARVELLSGWDHVHAARGANQDGYVGGVGVGYDVQVGHFVVGVEGEANDATTRATANNVLRAGDVYRLEAGRDLYAGGRIGAEFRGALVYVKGGYTNARYNERYLGGNGAQSEIDRNLDGYRVGGGLEKTVLRHGFVKAEYRYSHYGRDDVTGFKPERHQVVAGVGVRF